MSDSEISRSLYHQAVPAEELSAEDEVLLRSLSVLEVLRANVLDNFCGDQLIKATFVMQIEESIYS